MSSAYRCQAALCLLCKPLVTKISRCISLALAVVVLSLAVLHSATRRSLKVARIILHVLQDEVRNNFLLTGAVQEYPVARPLFFHRLAGVAKFEPTSRSYLRTTHLPAQALSADQFAPLATHSAVMEGRNAGFLASWPADAFVNAVQDCAGVQTAMACIREISGKTHNGLRMLPLNYWPHLNSAIRTSYAFFEELYNKVN